MDLTLNHNITIEFGLSPETIQLVRDVLASEGLSQDDIDALNQEIVASAALKAKADAADGKPSP